MNKQNIVLGLAVIALILGILALNKPATVQTVVRELHDLGAITGPDINSEYLNVNGVTRTYQSKNFAVATTTVCALKSPNATSTLITATATGLASTSASQIVLARASTPFATTTNFATLNLAADTRIDIVASTTPINTYLFPPNNYFVISQQGGAPGTTFSPSGRCSAVWQSL